MKHYYILIDEIQLVSEIQNPYVDDPNAKINFIEKIGRTLPPLQLGDECHKNSYAVLFVFTKMNLQGPRVPLFAYPFW